MSLIQSSYLLKDCHDGFWVKTLSPLMVNKSVYAAKIFPALISLAYLGCT